MVNCSFCGNEIQQGSGKMYVKKDGRIQYFCSSKCEKNVLNLGRRARNVRWTADGRKARAEASAKQN